jgi:TPR repeat protein
MKGNPYSVIIFIPALTICFMSWGQASTTSSGGYFFVKNGVEYYSTAPAPAAPPSSSSSSYSTYYSNSVSKPEPVPDSKPYTYSDAGGITDYFNHEYAKSMDELLHCNNRSAMGDDMIGIMYEKGLGTAKNYTEAVKYYKKCADQGDDNGQYSYGKMLFMGLGVTQNTDEAMVWFQRAAAQGLEAAKHMIYVGSLNGDGSYTLDGVRYYGNLKNGLLDGHGTQSSDAETLTGEWKNGKLNGHGTRKTDLDSYEGELKDGKMDGQGIYSTNSGSKYEGGFKDGAWFGQGVYTGNTGTKLIATWAGDRIPANCKYQEIFPNGKTKMECTYVGFLPEGKAIYYYESGNLHVAMSYKNGLPDGAYKAYYENGALWSDCEYRGGKLWNTIADNMPDGTSTGSYVKEGNGVAYQQSPDGKTIISKTTYENGVAVKTEAVPAK